MNKRFAWIMTIFLALGLAVTLLWAATPCNDLDQCWDAAAAYCDQVEGTWATGASLIREVGVGKCEMCCYDPVWGETCATMTCTGELPL